MAGTFITIEGGEGVGKSLFVKNLSNALSAAGVALVTTREPGGTPTADKVREIFARPAAGDPLSMEAEALLVSASRAQHVSRLIRPALSAGKWVLCDRFADSTRVYQGKIGGIPRAALEQMILFSTGGLGPHLTFLLDCDVDVSLARLQVRSGAAAEKSKAADDLGRGRGEQGDRVEQLSPDLEVKRYDSAKRSFHERLRLCYNELAAENPERIVILNAEGAPEDIANAAMSVIRERYL